MGGETYDAGSMDAYWIDVAAPDESCVGSSWLDLSTRESTGVSLTVQMDVPVDFADGGLAELAAAPIPASVGIPGLISRPVEGDLRDALSGGTASWADDGEGSLQLTIDGADLCSYNGGTDMTNCAGTDTVSLDLQGAVGQSDVCFTGVAGPILDANDTPYCVIDGGSINQGGWDCEQGPDHPVNG